MANESAFKAGFNFGETAELFEAQYEIKPAPLPSGEYTNVNGNTALAWGCVAAGQLAKLPVFLGSYPITPASDILHELAKPQELRRQNVPGRRRDRGLRSRTRCRLRRQPRVHNYFWAWARVEG